MSKLIPFLSSPLVIEIFFVLVVLVFIVALVKDVFFIVRCTQHPFIYFLCVPKIVFEEFFHVGCCSMILF